jgi:endonuclease/exonuclease/phosphatase family metal-dependent hydrolase
MTRRTSALLGLLTLLLGCASTATESSSPDVPFTVMTFNIRYGTALDGANAWRLRCDMLAQRIVDQAPAILGVQEALAAQITFLERHLPHHQRIGQGRDGGTKGEHAALFIDRRRFEVLTSGDFWLSETPDVVASVGWDADLTRICTWASLREIATGRTLQVWNAHFDHRGAKARRHSAEMIAQRVTSTPGPNLVLGDFNSGEHTPPLAALFAAGLRDTFRDVHPEATAVGTFHAFKGGTSGDKIDYVLAGNGLATKAAAILSAAGPNGHWPSDHHPVLATVVFAPN